jgi:hypothetical protein
MFEPPIEFEEANGSVVIEAERYTDALDGSWIERADHAGFTGHGYVVDHFTLEGPPRGWSETRGLMYRVDLTGGDYRVWVRRRIPPVWGTRGRGGESSDSAWIGVDGVVLGTTPEGGASGSWEWVPVGSIPLAAGAHQVELRVREGGLAVDRIVLTRGDGPPA